MSQLPVVSTATLPGRSDDFHALMELAEMLAKSQYFADARSAAQAAVKIMAGREMGFGPIASMSDVHIIEGKPSIGAHLRAAAIKRSDRYHYRVIDLTRERCELEFLEARAPGQAQGWDAMGRVVMTFKEAVDSGLATGKDGKVKVNWARTPDDMLFARCISKGYRRYCPDLTGGVLAYDPDELDNVEPKRVEAEVQTALPVPPAVTTNGTPQLSVPNAPSPVPTNTTEQGDRLTEAEVSELSQLSLKRTEGERKLILGTILKVPELAKVPRSRLDWMRSALTHGLATANQTDTIVALMEKLQVPTEARLKRLRELYSVESVGHLLPHQATELEATLRKKLVATQQPATATA